MEILVIELEMSFTKDDVLRMEVTDIKENGDFIVKTLNFPGHSLASVKDSENGQLAGVSTQGNRNDVKEEFSSVADKALGNYSPWSEIMIARDTNNNGKVTWQDAAIKYRENMEEVEGADYVRNSFSYIPFNIGSLTQMPFLRTADYI